ncbi:hypothetical protein MUG78_16775 [Gordonia alkaliphila]|nr:hypothetical protein [Gordonia alkaliphila]MCK0441055.1 hypothetical protein [Gordonia alkaliphila]
MAKQRTETELREALRTVVQDFNIGASVDHVIADWRDAGLIDHIEVS